MSVTELLQQRETGARKTCVPRTGNAGTEADIRSWAESDFLEYCEAKYVAFNPAPRSTIALSYSCDGTLLASTHGDHTVKITSCDGESVTKSLTGHRRTPWVVRFHPRERYILASGSLDHEVRLWNAETGECLRKYTFGKPIASLSFHYESDVLAIACGHKLYMWDYKQQGSKPEIVLKTRRSMRAVHFHPHGLPVVLTAEVMDPSDTRNLPVTLTDQGPFCGVGKANTGVASEDDPSSVTTSAMWMERPVVEPEEMMDATNTGSGSLPVLPPSMVPLGWEVPFPSAVRPVVNLPGVAPPPPDAGQSNESEPGQGAQLAAATYNSLWNIIGEDQPPRVWLRIWSFNSHKHANYLEGDKLLLSIQDAVLCSEMGVDFSRCGRYLAATMACRAHMQSSFQAGFLREIPVSMDWSPDHQNQRLVGTTRDQQSQISMPIAERVVFEVRIIAMDGLDFGKTLKAKRIRAAHCLTSVQFSPTGEHILLAYGKKHSSLLRSLVAQQNSLIPLHTIMEIARTSDMMVTQALPSTDDEINAAAFHPCPGGGLAYGTKEGKLRFVLANRNRFSPFHEVHKIRSPAPPSEQSLRDFSDLRLMMHRTYLSSQSQANAS